MKKNKYLIGIDTETCNGLIDPQNKLDLSQSLCYDVGWMVVDKYGKIYEKKSFVVAEIFLDENLMKDALFKDKIPQYWEEIKSGERKLKTFKNIRLAFLADRKKYNVKNVFAHNAFFDYTALNNTLRYLSGSKYRWFFPYKVELWDTLKMSRDAIGTKEEYTRFCEENNYLTKWGQNRLTAEILYRFISGDNEFLESHTGMEDVDIERQILAYCFKQKVKMRKTLFNKRV